MEPQLKWRENSGGSLYLIRSVFVYIRIWNKACRSCCSIKWIDATSDQSESRIQLFKQPVQDLQAEQIRLAERQNALSCKQPALECENDVMPCQRISRSSCSGRVEWCSDQTDNTNLIWVNWNRSSQHLIPISSPVPSCSTPGARESAAFFDLSTLKSVPRHRSVCVKWRTWLQNEASASERKSVCWWLCNGFW